MSDVRIIHGDCLDVLPTLEAGSVDAIITDPPYNVGFVYHGHDDQMPDYAEWCSKWFAECRRVCSGPVAISCGVGNLALWCRICEPDWVMCWHKPAARGRSPLGVNNWEPIILYGKSPNRGVNDVVRAPIKVRDDTGNHPCPKPLDWGAGLVKALTKPGQSVLDPFSGSGTIPVACMKAGRNCIAIEKDETYIPIIHRRVAEARTPLFDRLETA